VVRLSMGKEWAQMFKWLDKSGFSSRHSRVTARLSRSTSHLARGVAASGRLAGQAPDHGQARQHGSRDLGCLSNRASRPMGASMRTGGGSLDVIEAGRQGRSSTGRRRCSPRRLSASGFRTAAPTCRATCRVPVAVRYRGRR
jgi:hypothetical protein